MFVACLYPAHYSVLSGPGSDLLMPVKMPPGTVATKSAPYPFANTPLEVPPCPRSSEGGMPGPCIPVDPGEADGTITLGNYVLC